MREFTAWNARRAMDVYRAGTTMPRFQWPEGDRFYDALRNAPDAGALRAFVRETYGAAWTREVMGF
jgi:hypothetical protein